MAFSKIYILSIVFLINGEASEVGNKRAELPEDCGVARFQKNSRIVNGEEANVGLVPWMARIGKIIKETGKPFFTCGGSIINSYYIVSAAHCKEGSFDIVRLGENDVRTDVDCDKSGICAPPHQDIRVRRIVDPNFCPTSMENDIILIELRDAIQFNDFVQPVCLPNNTFTRQELEAEPMMISGWGLTKHSSILTSEILMYIYAPLLNSSNCNNLFTSGLFDTQLCIGYPKGRDSCNGDSGGPVTKFVNEDGIRRGYLIGVVSYGLIRCGDGPAVYTDVNAYVGWMENVMDSGTDD